MSGSTIGGVVGGAIGFFFGGPTGAQWGFMIGSAVGGYVDPEVIKNQGPRLSDATSQTARDGIPITFGYGTFPTSGNIIWRAPLVENVVTTRERQGKGGGPVVENTTYQYTRSFAIGICEGPITGLLIVKENGAIVYDARTDAELTAVGYTAAMISATRAGSAAFMRNAVVYLGSETQMPDSVIEAHEGVGEVEPHRGLAYIRFENKDLTDMRGAIAQYEFVVCAQGTVTPAEEEGGLRFHWPFDEGTGAEIIDGKDAVLNGTLEGPPLNLYSDSSLYLPSISANAQADYPLNTFDVGDGGETEWSVSVWCRPTSISGGSGGKIIASAVSSAANGTMNWQFQLDVGPNNMRPRFVRTHNAFGGDDAILAPFELSVNETAFMVATWVQTEGDGSGTLTFYVGHSGEIWSSSLEDVPGVALSSNYVTFGDTEFPSAGGFIGYISNCKVYDVALTPEQIAALYLPNDGSYSELPDIPGGYVDPDGNIVNVSSEQISRTPVNVSDIITDICDRRGIDASQIDVSDIDDTVIGFRVASEGGGDVHIAPLLIYAFADAGEWDGKLRFVKRGGSSLYTITADDLIEREGDAIGQTRAQEAELLRKNTVQYIDPLATYTPTTQTWERRAGTVQAKGEASVELAIVADADTMAQVAEKRGKVAWAEVEKYDFGLPMPKFAKVTPTDVFTVVDRDSVSHRIRAMKTEEDSGALLLEDAARDRQPAYIGTVSGASPPTTSGATPPPARGPTVFRAFHAPALTEAQQTGGIYHAGTGLLPGWIGYDLYYAIGDGDFQYAGRYLSRAKIGWLTAGITSSSDPIPVQLYDNRTVETLSAAQLAANQGYFTVVSEDIGEIKQYETATDTGAGYDLSDISHGQANTVATSHSANDPVVFLDSAVNLLVLAPQYAGQVITLWPISLGTNAADNPTYTITYDPAEYILDGNGEDDDGEDGPTPGSGGAGTPGTPTSRTTAAGSTTVSLTAGEANAAANSAAVNTALASFGTVIFPAGTYYIDTSDPIEPPSQRKLDLDTNGTILRAAGSNTTTLPSVHRDIIRIDGVNNVIVVGGELIGYRDYWAANGGVSAFGVSEWGHGIYVTNSATNVTIYNMSLSKFIGDGISLGRSTSNVHVLNVLSTNNRRQGISVAGTNQLIENCECSYIGIGDGTSPKAGIDIEVDEPATNTATNITVTGCYLHHNAGPGLIAYKSCNSLTITSNRMEYNTKGVYAVDSDTVDLHDNDIKWNKYEGVHLTGTCTNWDLDGNDFFSNKTKQYGTFTTGATTTSPTATQKAKHITIGSGVTGTTYGTNTYGPV